MDKKTMYKIGLKSIIAQFFFNPKSCRPKDSNTHCSQETPKHEKLGLYSTLISIVKKKMSFKNRHECDQEIIGAETEKAIKNFENNKSPANDDLPVKFFKISNDILKTDLLKMYLETSQLRQMPRSMAGSYILFVQKRRQRGHNYLASNLLTQL